jgi:hypothetical protein
VTAAGPAALRRVGGDALTATVDPRRGAKIVSLLDGRGHEWLLPPRELEAPLPAGSGFTDAEMGGWDECAPSIVACPTPDGRPVPDHGDLWNVEWTGAGATLTARGRALDYEFSRAITPIDAGLRFTYTVLAHEDTAFLWAAHPQFSAPAGSRVLIDLASVVDVLDDAEALRAWPATLSEIDSVPPGGCRKVYAAPDAPVDHAVLDVPGRGRLVMSWDAAVAPYLGVWFDNGAYARRPVIALEPSTGYYDSLALAVRNGRVLHLRAGQPVQWQLEVRVA